MTLAAHRAQESVLKHTAAQVFIEFFARMVRQGAIFLGKARKERWIVLVHQRIQASVFGHVSRVARFGREGHGSGSHAYIGLPLWYSKMQHAMPLCSDGCTALRSIPSCRIGDSPTLAWEIDVMRVGYFLE